MTIETIIAAVLALSAIVAIARLCLRQYRAQPGQGARARRLILLLAAQPLAAALLYFALLPPRLPGQAGAMVVATADAGAATAQAAGDVRIALPQAPATAIGERVPDLATALRRHPDTQRLRVLGAGLTARDRDAANGRQIEFVPAPLPRGLTSLWSPQRVAEGEDFAIAGRVEAMPGGSVELLDPGLQRVDRAIPRGDGGFLVHALARGAGLATFKLRLRDARQRVIEEVDVPVAIAAVPAPKLLLLAGAPGPELKYLRRWALDAGLKPHTQISVGAGLQLGDAPIALDAASLSGFDLLVLDERAWESLSASQRGAAVGAARAGLGVLLRVSGPLSPALRAQWRQLGFETGAGNESNALRWPAAEIDEAASRARLGPGSADAPRPRDQAPAQAPALTRRVLALDGADLQPLGRDADGKAFAAWRAIGQGRMGVTGLSDSFRLVLAGRDDLHARLWSDAFSVLARARAGESARVEGASRQGERMRLCGLSESAQVLPPRGPAVALLIDPAAGDARCAGFWPTATGWHALRQGERTLPFYVRGRDEAPGLRASELREATAALRLAALGAQGSRTSALDAGGARGSRWPWFFAWLIVSAGLWWLERSRRGRR
ncbi:carboxypeptidase regulatory-like domain-containing protein [Lysobacter sp. CA199]|uniref:carboxypeptidase regulatory-like domain-containing protein n=1 Tax=Lysobacter sp. CA199 TaxID=3455608 RepID=UPI003F8D0838